MSSSPTSTPWPPPCSTTWVSDPATGSPSQCAIVRVASTFAAAVHVGATAVLINSWGSAEELQFTLGDSDPTVLAADLPRTRLAADALRQRRTAVLFSDVDGDEQYPDDSMRIRRADHP